MLWCSTFSRIFHPIVKKLASRCSIAQLTSIKAKVFKHQGRLFLAKSNAISSSSALPLREAVLASPLLKTRKRKRQSILSLSEKSQFCSALHPICQERHASSDTADAWRLQGIELALAVEEDDLLQQLLRALQCFGRAKADDLWERVDLAIPAAKIQSNNDAVSKEDKIGFFSSCLELGLFEHAKILASFVQDRKHFPK